ncbi:MAG: hypothetical protein WC712_11040 [Candidatus Brocadiia bacterium]
MDERIPPSKKALIDALALSGEILKNIELSEIPLASVALKAARLARLLNDSPIQKTMEYEASGYPVILNVVEYEAYQLAVNAGREIQTIDSATKAITKGIFPDSIEELERQLKFLETALSAAQDPDVSVSSANPNQIVWNPLGNSVERSNIRADATLASKRLAVRRSFIYSYVLRRHDELRFSGIADDIFSRIRQKVDSAIGEKVPHAIQKLTSVYENLQSDNPEDWSNAVHSCRRLLKDLADALCPPHSDVVLEQNGRKRTVKLGPENYINRIIFFVEEHSESARFTDIVGSHLKFIGERLDSVSEATQKGSHDKIVSREEADRYVVYTYLLTGDILSLL